MTSPDPIPQADPPFPRRLTVAVLTVILGIVCWLGARVYLSYAEFDRLHTAHLRSKDIQTVILQLDELLTMSARMAVATRDAEWVQRYQTNEPKLDAAIVEMEHLSSEPSLVNAARTLREANAELVVMEHQAIGSLNRNPRVAEDLLSSPLYADRKAKYAAAAKAFHAELDLMAKTDFENRFGTEMTSLAIATIAILLTVLAGMLLAHRLRRWQTITIAGLQELRAAETHLQALRKQMELILNSAAEGIYGLDLEGRLTFINPAAEAMLGCPASELIGQPMHPVLHHSFPDGRPYPVEDCPIYAALHDGRTHLCADEVFWRKDGSHFPVEYASNPIIDDDRIVGAVVTFNDISERRERERLQAESTAALAQAESLKNQFLSMVSHELRTPVSVILSSANLLSFQYGSFVSEGQRKHVDKITRASQRLMGLLADLLDATQIQAGTFQLHRRPVRPDTVIDEAVESIEHVAAHRSQRISQHIPDDLSEIDADPDRLVQVLSNLLHNASKFTPSGGTIDLTVERAGADLRFTVKDSGPGIDPDKQGQLFQRFTQFDVPVHSEGRSMGLGLFIGKALVEAHGGCIGVESTPGEGSCFWFTVPMTPSADDGDNMTIDPISRDK